MGSSVCDSTMPSVTACSLTIVCECVSLTIECVFVQMPSTWSNTSVDISLDNLSPLGKLQKSNAPSVYQLQQQRMMHPAAGMGQPAAGMGQPAAGMAAPGETRPLDMLL